MLTIIVVVIVSVALFVWLSPFGYRLSSILIGLMMGLMFGCVVSGIVGDCLPQRWVQTDQYDVQLVSLRNGQGVQGSFFLGSGTIGTQERYYYYYQTKNGGYKQAWVSVKKAEVFEEDRKDGQATFTEYRLELEKPWYKWLGLLSGGTDWQCDFHIPKGSLIRQFVLN